MIVIKMLKIWFSWLKMHWGGWWVMLQTRIQRHSSICKGKRSILSWNSWWVRSTIL